MALLSRLFGKQNDALKVQGSVTFPPVLKEDASDPGPYSVWIENHKWNSKNEEWCKRQIPKFKSQPTIGILMQSSNPRPDFLRESFSSIFNQVYPFHRLYVVDRGSNDKTVRGLIEEVEKDPRVKVSFQKGAERDTEAIARIMKKADSEWLFLMGAEDVIEPYALYYMAAYLQDQVEIDFVFADSDLIDDHGLRFAPQFKPVWAVGASYPLGYYQHPLLMSARIVAKVQGYERAVTLMEEGTLLDEASNHSRYVIQAPGILYHARARGLKNENPPEAVWNVLVNENLISKNNEIGINSELRIAAEPAVPLKILWLLDSLDLEDGTVLLLHVARYLHHQGRHEISIVSTIDGPLHPLYEKLGKVMIVDQSELSAIIESLHKDHAFDVAFVSSLKSVRNPGILQEINVPVVWQLPEESVEIKTVQEHLNHASTVLISSESRFPELSSLDTRGVVRILPIGVDLGEIKIYKQGHSPIDLRAEFQISRSASIITIVGPTVERKRQKMFVDAALALKKRQPQAELEFFIVGAREGLYLNQLKSKVQESGESQYFHFINEEESPASRYPYFWISDVCVSCSISETFPLAVLEAMAFKKAVIGTRVFSINQIIQDGGNGFLVNSGDTAGLTDKLEMIALDKDYAEALGREGLELAMEKYALKKTATQFERYLRESIVF